MLAQTNSSICESMVALMLKVVSTLVRFSEATPRRSSAFCREDFSGLLPHLVMGGMRESMLNPVLSLASSKIC